MPTIKDWLGKSDNAKCIHALEAASLIDESNSVFNVLQSRGPLTPEQLKTYTGLSGVPLDKTLEDLSRKQAIAEIGFTPTDALHVLGKLSFGETKLSLEAASVLGKLNDQSAEEFSLQVLAETETHIENMIIDYIIQRFWGNSLTGFISSRKSHPVLDVAFSLKIPLIGIGAAAKHLLPAVAERMGTTVTFPDNCEVGNAIGAALICNNNLK